MYADSIVKLWLGKLTDHDGINHTSLDDFLSGDAHTLEKLSKEKLIM